MNASCLLPIARALGAGLLLALLLSDGTQAQTGAGQPETAEPPKRPRIGLALSGGGARGAAHVGVLKVLEELRVPVHCIAGTSMGSVVGGAFAAGTTPAEMEKVINTTDWNAVFTDAPPRGEIAIRRKADDYKPLFAPEFGFRDGEILLPKGVVAGVTIESFLRVLTEPASGIQQFSQLPIPFRAVAADIVTGEAVVLDHGSLPRAMRASMAIPGAVTPVEIDGRLLVDGGIANNLPIDVTRQVCAEVVIAVNISTPPLKREELDSALAIVAQLINFLGKDTVDKQIASLTARDVLIAPDLGTITSASFERTPEAVRIGEAAARKMADALKRYSIPEAEYAALRKTQIPQRKGLGTVAEIRFEGIQRTNPEVLAALVESKPGEELSEAKIAADLRRIYGRGDFEAVDYRIEQGEAAKPALVITVREKSFGPDYLRFGLGLATDFKGAAYFNLLGQYRKTWLNHLGGEWLLEAQVGQNTYLFTEFYQPVEPRGGFFVAPYAGGGQYTRPVFVNDDRIAEYQAQEARIGLDLGAALGTWGELRIGPVLRWIDAEVSTGPPALPSVDVNASGVRLRLFGDRLDTPWFSRAGDRLLVQGSAALTGMGATQSYQRLMGTWTGAASFGPHTISATLLGGTDFNSNLPAYDAFLLGGPFRLSGYQIDQFAGQKMAYGSLRYYNRILRLPAPLGSGVYLGASGEVGRMDGLNDGRSTTGTLWSASIFIGAETFLGPAFFGFGTGGGGNNAVYLLLGAP
jgi:NTE family protein